MHTHTQCCGMLLLFSVFTFFFRFLLYIIFMLPRFMKPPFFSFSFLVFEKSGDYVFGFHQCFIFWLKNYWIFFMSSGMPVREENKTFMKVKNRKRHNCEMNDCRNATTHQFSQLLLLLLLLFFHLYRNVKCRQKIFGLLDPH